jgi:hypothetical protein
MACREHVDSPDDAVISHALVDSHEIIVGIRSCAASFRFEAAVRHGVFSHF